MSTNQSFLPLCVLLLITVFAVSPASPRQNQNQNSNKNGAQYREKLGSESDLLLVQVLTSHGDSTPLFLEPASFYNSDTFPEGLGALTNDGKKRFFEYGKDLAKLYKSYLKHFFVRNVIAQSSPIRRCLEMHEALLAGMFPPSKKRGTIWLDPSDTGNKIAKKLAQLWNPIGIQSVELSRSWKTNPDAPCPVAEALVADMPNRVPSLAKLLRKTVNFRKKVLKYSGLNSTDWRVYGFLYDTMYAGSNYFGNTFHWPSWLDKVGTNTVEKLKEFDDFNFAVFGDKSVPEEILRLRTGALMAELIENMRTAAKTIPLIKANNRKFFTYTSHDVMVGYLLNLFGVFKKRPTYGNGLILELRRDFRTQLPNVYLFYANVTYGTDIIKLELDKAPRFRKLCKEAVCPLELFAQSLASIINVKPEVDCQKK